MRTCVLAGSCPQLEVTAEGGNNTGYVRVFLDDELVSSLSDSSSTDTNWGDCCGLNQTTKREREREREREGGRRKGENGHSFGRSIETAAILC